MSYRTYVGTTKKNTYQILGNNECYIPLLEELKRQGIEVDDDGCFSGEIKELQPIIDVLENYIYDKAKEVERWYHKSIFDMTPDEIDKNIDLTYSMIEKQECAYIFTTANLIKHLGDDVERIYDTDLEKFIYKIKDNKKIYFEAY